LNRRQQGKRLIVASAAIGSLGPFGMHVLLPALPAIATGFAVRASTTQLLVSLSLVAIAFGNLTVAPLSDRFGRRPVILAGLGLFLAGSLCGLVAPSIGLLVLARIVQAFGAGAAMAVSRATITDFFGVARAAGAMATTATAVLVVPMFAPTLGGFTVEWLGWRGAFALAILMGAVVMYFTLARTTETHPRQAAAGPSPRTLSSYRRLLASPGYRAYVLFGSCMMGSVTVFITSAPYVAIEVLGVSPSTYGMLFFLPALASFLGFFFTSRMARRLGGLRMMRMGAGVAFAGSMALMVLAALGVMHPLALFLPGMLVCGANALSAPNSTTGAIASAPDVAGAASGMLGFVQLLVGAAATQLVAYLANGTPFPLVGAIGALNLCALGLLFLVTRRGPIETVTRTVARSGPRQV
jgi:DHA1 family bicyclomycin/chloramphenicol resistance-like MFS transporter